MKKEDRYADARMNLDGAMAEFINAALDVGKDNYDIAKDVGDSLFDASQGAIRLIDWHVK